MQITEKKLSALTNGLNAVDGVMSNGIHTGFKALDKDLALLYFPDGATVIGAGYPIGAFVATDAVADHFKPGDHGTTLGGNPLAAAVGNAVFDEIFQADLLNNSNIRGQQLADGLRQIAKNTGVIAEVKGLGLLIGVQFTDAVSSADILNACFEENMLVAGAKHNVIRLLPPLNVTETEIDEALLKFASAVEKSLK